MSNELNKYSSQLTQVRSQVGSQAMLYATGMTEEDMSKPQVGIASMGWEGNPCNMHLNGLAAEVKGGVQDAGLVGLIFHTIGVSDGIALALWSMVAPFALAFWGSASLIWFRPLKPMVNGWPERSASRS